jgi:hypothetical protein
MPTTARGAIRLSIHVMIARPLAAIPVKALEVKLASCAALLARTSTKASDGKSFMAAL